MINEDVINQYTLEFKRKQWVRSWRLLGEANKDWLRPYLDEMFKRGAYPISFLNLANYYSDKKDQGLATLFGARFIGNTADILKQIEKMHTLLGEHPFDSFCRRDFVHWKSAEQGSFLDYIYRIYETYGSLQNGILYHLRYACDPGEALYCLMKDGGVEMSLPTCRLVIIRLATDYGLGLGIMDCFDKDSILPPLNDVTKWYVKSIFPADAPFDLDDLVLIMGDEKPYEVMYQALMLRIMQQADAEQVRVYLWAFCKTFYGYPTKTTKIAACTGSKTPYQYITDIAPVYDWETQTLSRNPMNPQSATWVNRTEYLQTQEFKEKVQRSLEERDAKRHAKRK